MYWSTHSDWVGCLIMFCYGDPRRRAKNLSYHKNFLNWTHTIKWNIRDTYPILMNARTFGKQQNKQTQHWTTCEKVISKSDACLDSNFSIWHVKKLTSWNIFTSKSEKLLVQNLTHCKHFYSDFDTLWSLLSKTWLVEIFLNPKLTSWKTLISKSDTL